MKRMLKVPVMCLIASMLFAGCSQNEQGTTKTTEAITQETVSLKAGNLVGFREDGVYTFRGIPYATAERFQMPEPVTSYENNKQMALTYGAVASQAGTMSEAGPSPYEFMTPTNGTADMSSNENCQYLNVWSNDLSGDKPVIVFFHGGGIISGASSELSGYTGKYFAENEDAVFVSVNHRLNVLGYLDLSNYGGSEYANSGLAGIEDCVVALQWVQDNISSFGGDPDNVTIVGQSGGVEKVTTLASMSNTVDLFDKVVYMSGYYTTSPKEDGEINAEKLADYLNVNDEELISTLEAMSYDELLKASQEAECNWTLNYGIGTYEKPFIDEDGKMNEYAAQRTWIVGTTYSEFNTNALSLITEGQKETNYLPDLTDDKVESMLKETYGEETSEIIEEFKKAYPDHELGELLFLNQSDAGFTRYGLIKENGLLDLFNKSGATVYNYVTAYKQPYFGGVTMYHSADIPFWFHAVDEIEYLIKGDSENAHNVSSNMANALAAFASTGNPSTNDMEWKPYTNEDHNTMVFDTNTELKSDYDLQLYKSIME